MSHQQDSLVVTTLARTARAFATQDTGAAAGVAFKQALYAGLLDVANWLHTAGPDEFDMGDLLHSRTGIRYEFDCALLSSDALYVIEAKRHARITRQHISEFVSKLLDVSLGSASELSAPDIKPIFVSGLSQIDAAAWQYAVSWGVPIVTPTRPTPWELLALLSSSTHRSAASARRKTSRPRPPIRWARPDTERLLRPYCSSRTRSSGPTSRWRRTKRRPGCRAGRRWEFRQSRLPGRFRLALGLATIPIRRAIWSDAAAGRLLPHAHRAISSSHDSVPL